MEPIVIVSAVVVVGLAGRALRDAINDLKQEEGCDSLVSRVRNLIGRLRRAGSPEVGGWQLRRAPYYYSPYFHAVCPATNKRRHHGHRTVR